MLHDANLLVLDLVFKRDNPRPTVTSFRIGADGSNEAISLDSATEDLIVQLSEKIFANRHRLKGFWGKEKRISTQQWDDGMQQVLRIYISWPKVRSMLCKVDRDGTIIVDDFLKSFQLRLPTYDRLILLQTCY